MGVIDEVLEANEIYSRTHELRRLTPRPARHLAILTCMDTRLSIRTFGLTAGDAHIIRNAGGIVTDDSLRSLLISHYLLDTQEIMVINHTDCGLMHTSEQDLRTRIQNRTARIATNVDHSSLVCGIDGTRVSRTTRPQSAPTTNAVMGYAKSTSTNHLSTFAIW
jgi:carbonic anhydrase